MVRPPGPNKRSTIFASCGSVVILAAGMFDGSAGRLRLDGGEKFLDSSRSPHFTFLFALTRLGIFQ